LSHWAQWPAIATRAGRQAAIKGVMRLFRRGRGRRAATDQHLIAAAAGQARRRPDPADVLAGATPEQALAQTYAMLYAASPALNPDSGYAYAREALPGLLEVLAYDSPDSFRLLTDGDVDRLGGVTALRQAGRANLRALPVESAERVTPADGIEFDVLSGESVYTASRALVLGDTLGQLGQAEPPRGVLACLPSRHQLAVHPIGGQDPAIAPLSEMAQYAQAGYSQGIGRLSPHVYWWHDGAWEQVSTVRDGRVDLHLDSDLLSPPDGLC
jgi:hypothetical protein